MSLPTIHTPVVLVKVSLPPSHISYPTTSEPPRVSLFATCLSLRESSFSILQTISPSTSDSVNLVMVDTANVSNWDASSRASTSPTSSRYELKALLVNGKQVSSGHGLSISMHPGRADARSIRTKVDALYTFGPGRASKYAFLMPLSWSMGLRCPYMGSTSGLS